jgi:amino acid transporter
MMLTNIIIPMSVALNHYGLSSSEFVFKKYINETGFDDSKSITLPLVVIVGSLLGPLTIVGYEGSALLAEETQNAEKAAPLGMIKTVAFSGLGGLIMFISLLFAIRDDPDTILAGPTHQPIVNVF